MKQNSNLKAIINIKLFFFIPLFYFIPIFIFLLIVHLVATSGGIYSTQLGPTVVATQFGKLRGTLITFTNSNLSQVQSYKGLQFASLMGGELRFVPPTAPTERWDNIRPAIQFKPVCPQNIPNLSFLSQFTPNSKLEHLKRLIPFLQKQSEDCLYLNVYVPVRDNFFSINPSSSPKSLTPAKLSVAVFLHGDSYEIGTGNAYDGSALAASGGHIVVTINFRMGILGFMSTGDSNSPGNYALLDQIAALRWVQSNIEAFGGDPKNVCLLGHGVGAAMANMLASSSLVRGKNLFNKLILQSGTAHAPWAIAREHLIVTRKMSEKVGCFDEEGEEKRKLDPSSSINPMIVQCLKQIPISDLLKATSSISPPPFMPLFGPVIDGRVVNSFFFPSKSRQLGISKTSTLDFQLPVMIGYTLGEGQAFFNQSVLENGLSQDSMWQLVRSLVETCFHHQRQTILDILMHQYRNWESNTKNFSKYEVRNLLFELITDAFYASPALHLAKSILSSLSLSSSLFFMNDYFNQLNHPDSKHLFLKKATESSHVYLYCFNRMTRNQLSVYQDFTSSEKIELSKFPFGTIHGDDLPFTFGAPISQGIDPFPDLYDQQDKVFNEVMLSYLTNFIKTGSPNTAQIEQQINNETKSFQTSTSTTPPTLTSWPPFSLSDQNTFMMENSKFFVKSFFRTQKMALWLDLLPNIHKTQGVKIREKEEKEEDRDEKRREGGIIDDDICRALEEFKKNNNDKNKNDNNDNNKSDFPEDYLKFIASCNKKGINLQHSDESELNRKQNLHSNRFNLDVAKDQSNQTSSKYNSSRKQFQNDLDTTKTFIDSFDLKPNLKINKDLLEFPSGEKEKEEEEKEDGEKRKKIKGPHNLPLVVVIGVGCILLTGNILLFVAVYLRRRRKSRRKPNLIVGGESCVGARITDAGESDVNENYSKQRQQQLNEYFYQKANTRPHCKVSSSINYDFQTLRNKTQNNNNFMALNSGKKETCNENSIIFQKGSSPFNPHNSNIANNNNNNNTCCPYNINHCNDKTYLTTTIDSLSSPYDSQETINYNSSNNSNNFNNSASRTTTTTLLNTENDLTTLLESNPSFEISCTQTQFPPSSSFANITPSPYLQLHLPRNQPLQEQPQRLQQQCYHLSHASQAKPSIQCGNLKQYSNYFPNQTTLTNSCLVSPKQNNSFVTGTTTSSTNQNHFSSSHSSVFPSFSINLATNLTSSSKTNCSQQYPSVISSTASSTPPPPNSYNNQKNSTKVDLYSDSVTRVLSSYDNKLKSKPSPSPSISTVAKSTKNNQQEQQIKKHSPHQLSSHKSTLTKSPTQKQRTSSTQNQKPTVSFKIN